MWSRGKMCFILAVVSVAIIVNGEASSGNPDGLEVETNNGKVRGERVEAILANGASRFVTAFRGIPFAKPPTGDLRFADPERVESWEGVRDATKFNKACVGIVDHTFPGFPPAEQWNPPEEEAGTSEDCLYLNIWVPQKEGPLPVMVWIFGGGFFSGAASLDLYNGKYLSASEDAIVVTLNYRLCSLGFLSTGDGRINGNFGIKDQQIALEWIKENIARFGGNENEITIMGESAGAFSVGLHFLLDGSRNLFNRGVMNSGSPISLFGFATKEEMKKRSTVLFKRLNCSDTDTDELMRCLRSIPASVFIEKDTIVQNYMMFTWVPVIDGVFLKENPKTMLKRGDFKKSEIILSFNKNEGTYWNLYGYPDQFNKDREVNPISFKNFKKDIRTSLDEDLSLRAQNRIIRTYSRGTYGNGVRLSSALDQVLGDRMFTCPVINWAKAFVRRGVPVYIYQLNYRASTEQWPEWMGVIHGADCQWTFGAALNRQNNYTDDEIRFAGEFMNYHGNFAKTGNPNGEGLPHWPLYEPRKSNTICFKEDTTIGACTIDRARTNRCWRWSRYDDSSHCCDLAEE